MNFTVSSGDPKVHHQNLVEARDALRRGDGHGAQAHLDSFVQNKSKGCSKSIEAAILQQDVNEWRVSSPRCLSPVNSALQLPPLKLVRSPRPEAGRTPTPEFYRASFGARFERRIGELNIWRMRKEYFSEGVCRGLNDLISTTPTKEKYATSPAVSLQPVMVGKSKEYAFPAVLVGTNSPRYAQQIGKDYAFKDTANAFGYEFLVLSKRNVGYPYALAVEATNLPSERAAELSVGDSEND